MMASPGNMDNPVDTQGTTLLRQSIDGLDRILDEEKLFLKNNTGTLPDSFAREKMQVLENFHRLMADQAGIDQIRNHQNQLVRIQEKLTENTSLLKFRIEAVSEISRTIEQARMESESDGTYDVRSGNGNSWI